MQAIVARAAGDVMGHDHAITGAKGRYLRADRCHAPGQFMAQDDRRRGLPDNLGNIRTAEAAAGWAQQDLIRPNFRNGHILNAHIIVAVIDNSFHGCAFCKSSGENANQQYSIDAPAAQTI
jgi:hypothetical protein